MSDSEKNDELDNYGVWVKKGPQTVDSSAAEEADFTMDMNLPDFSDLDLPDDTSSESTVDVTDSFLSDLDTDLSDITGDLTESSEQEAAANESSGETEDIALDEFIAGGEFEDVAEGNRGYGQEAAPASAAESTPAGEESVSLDDFLDGDSFESAPAEAPAPDTTAADEAPLDIDLSFDDSADSLATTTVDADVSVADEAAEESSASSLDGTESIDLSEFGFDDSAEDTSSMEAPATDAPAPETSEAPAAEEPVAERSGGDSFDEMFNSISEDSAIDASAFFDEPAEESPAEAAPAPAEASAGGEEEVDLSDFGFDDDSLASQGEVKDDTKSLATGTVDYEMNVMADDDLPPEAPAPEAVVPASEEMPIVEEPEQPVIEETAISNEELANLNSETAEEATFDMPAFEDTPAPAEIPVEEAKKESIEETTPQNIAQESAAPQSPAPRQDALASSAATAILSQIVGELSSLKNEIAGLKNDFEEMKNREVISAPVAEETAEKQESGGFFDDNGEDDTIALSTDELANIMNTADFETEQAEETVAEEAAQEAVPAEEAVTEEATQEAAPAEETVTEESTFDAPAESAEPGAETADDSDFVMPEPDAVTEEDNTLAGEETLSTDELANIMNTADFAHEQAEDNAMEESPAAEEDATEATVAENLDDSDFVMPEPGTVTEEDNTLAGEETLSTDELANIMNTADFAHEQAEDNAMEESSAAEEPIIEEAASDDFNFDAIEGGEESLPEEISVPKAEEPVETPVSFETENLASAAEEATAEEPVAAESEEDLAPVVEEPAATSAANDNDLSGDLKTEIKSVLSYMDKLLENLPEDKIAEFAQSEQFETYKKLFKELGLA